MILNMTYNSIGSGAGKRLIKEENISGQGIVYAGSDIPLTEEEKLNHPDLREFPVLTG